jgi:hypothetical protein
MRERRRAGRINARMLSRIAGVDADYKVRRSNFSVTGVYFEADCDIGEPGSVQKLCLMTLDKLHQVELMARVVRIFSINDIWKGSAVAGVAFDFMPHSGELHDKLEGMVRYLLRVNAEPPAPPTPAPAPSPELSVSMPAQVEGRETATVQALSVQGMTLETSWAADVGDVIRCELTAPASKRTIVLDGEVVDSVSDLEMNGSMSYHVSVRFHDRGRLPLPSRATAAGLSIGDALEALLEEAVFQPTDTGFSIPNEHLGGLLSRIRLASLLAFFEMERLTGVLTLTQGALTAQLFLKEGRVLDCEASQIDPDRLGALCKLLTWNDGKFEFSVAEVTRQDLINLSTTHLLLRLTQASDEANR